MVRAARRAAEPCGAGFPACAAKTRNLRRNLRLKHEVGWHSEDQECDLIDF
jgi:hypothetical protein